MSKTYASDSLCTNMTSTVGPYSSDQWCSIPEELGVFNIYGRASRSCTGGNVGKVIVQVDTYSDSTCGGGMIQTEMVPLGVCLPMMSGSFKLAIDLTIASGGIQYVTYSDSACKIQSTSTPILTTPQGMSACILPFTNSASNSSVKGIKMYVIDDMSEVMAPPPGSVVELVYPSTESSSNCQSGGGVDPIMVRYLRQHACLSDVLTGQYLKMSCGSDLSKFSCSIILVMIIRAFIVT